MKRSLLIIALSLFAASGAFADEVSLVNGRKLYGIVEDEDPFYVTLNVGPGYTKLRRSNILSIQKSAPQETDTIEDAFADKKLQDELQAEPYYRTRPMWGRKG